MPRRKSGYQEGREYAGRWLETDHRPIGNTASGYSILSRANAKSHKDNRYLRGFCLGVARVCRENLHKDA